MVVQITKTPQKDGRFWKEKKQNREEKKHMKDDNRKFKEKDDIPKRCLWSFPDRFQVFVEPKIYNLV